MSVVDSIRQTVDDPTTRLTASPWTPAALIFAAALVLRLLSLGHLPTTDESITVQMVRQYGTLELLWEIPVHQPHFPLYYVVLDVVGQVTGSIAHTRVLSFLAGAALPAVVLVWFRTVTSDRRALLATLVLAASPLLIVQSRWLRMYALLTLTVCLGWWAAHRWLDGGSPWAFAAGAVVTIGLHPFGMFAVGAQLAWLAWEQWLDEWRPGFRRILAGVAVLATAAAAFLAARILDVQGTGTIDRQNMHVSYAAQPVLRALVLPLTTLTGTLHTWHAIAVIALVAGWLCYRTVETRLWTSRPGRMALVWVWGSLGLLLLAQAVRPVLMLKYVGWLAPGVALWLALVVPNDRRSDVALAVVAGVIVANLVLAALHGSVSMVAIWGSGVAEGI